MAKLTNKELLQMRTNISQAWEAIRKLRLEYDAVMEGKDEAINDSERDLYNRINKDKEATNKLKKRVEKIEKTIKKWEE